MDDMNQTRVTEFIIVGFPGIQDPESKSILFAVFLTLYLIIVSGNLLLIGIFLADSGLHTPMYMTICNLAIIDITIPTCTVLTMLNVFHFASYAVPFLACFTQAYFFLALGSVECFILLIMAYDRYVAICHPLHYPAKMNQSLTLKLITLCWLGGFMTPIFPVLLGMTRPYCGPNKVLQCFCEFSGVLRLACADITLISFVSLTFGLCVLLIPIIFILISYIKIIKSVLQITSSEGRLKTFATCGSHLLVICVYFLTLLGVYISYRIPGTSVDMRIMASLFQNVFPPIMNPIIYCLRTKEIRASLLEKYVFHQLDVAFLSHILSSTGLLMDPSKVVTDWPKPNTIKRIQCFMGWISLSPTDRDTKTGKLKIHVLDKTPSGVTLLEMEKAVATTLLSDPAPSDGPPDKCVGPLLKPGRRFRSGANPPS
ncbi:olfactory receptor 1E5-like [Lepisosteus oculatus]|uniref:olfactory receptor 1E5-like n=1 Tax=Lepisosteus oculatus TaxID=7918 RepID=UPI0035F515EC